MSNSKKNYLNDASLMIIWCSKCKMPFDSKEGPLNSISHGFCPECFEEEMRLAKEKFGIKDNP